MARPRSVRHPVSRPHLVPGSSARAFPAAADQIQRARERLRASGNAALAESADPERELDDARAAARRRIADAQPKTPSEQIVANQEEILRRLTALASQVSRTSPRLDRIEAELFGAADPGNDPEPPAGDEDPTPDPDAPPAEPASDPSETPTQPLDPPLEDPAEPELPAPDGSPGPAVVPEPEAD